MKNRSSLPSFVKRASILIAYCLVLGLIISLASCNFLADEGDESLEKTQTALSIEQTALAQENDQAVQQTIAAQQATIDAQAAQATAEAGQQPPEQQPPSDDLGATQQAQAAEQTAIAQQATQQAQGQQPAQTQPPQQPPAGDFSQQMKGASILLYEDMVNDPSEYRYIQRTLDSMGLNYKDDGSAKGWLKSDLLGGAPGGGPWDLIILGAEWRESVSGEFFDYLQNVLDQGTSVILEAWYLDDISEGKISPILAKCGVQVYEYYPKTGTLNDLVVWPLPSASQHPIMTTPNGGLKFTKARDKWAWSFDLGDHTAYSENNRQDAQILMGADAQKEYMDGVLTVCMGGKFTMMTFSSHSFPYNVMYPLWENMIYNALKIRLTGSY